MEKEIGDKSKDRNWSARECWESVALCLPRPAETVWRLSRVAGLVLFLPL